MSAALPAAVQYTLRLQPQQHILHVRAVLPLTPAAALSSVELFLPVWTPGSYLVREYARQISAFAASVPSGAALQWQKVHKNRWRIALPATPTTAVQVDYQIYAHELSVRSNFMDTSFALIIGAATFMTAPDCLHLAHAVQLVLPSTWQHSCTSLPPDTSAQAAPHSYRAADYDALIDAPIYAGNPLLQSFTHAGKHITLLTEGADARWKAPQALADVQRLVAQQAQFWGDLPFERYIFFNLLTEGRGGLEHKNSAVLMASAWSGCARQDYIDWLGLVSHEFFHVWNMKRLRPLELGPFNYEMETPTHSLWIGEGFTAYYDDLLVHRAGLCNRETYLQRLAKTIGKLQTTPGRLVQALSEASWDAWIKFYRRDENSDNVAVSYYLKGSLIAFVLDALIRQNTQDQRSLDDVMRQALQRYAGARGYSESEFCHLASEMAGSDLQAFFATNVQHPGELDLQPALSYYGLTLGYAAAKEALPGEAANEPHGWLGINMRQEGSCLRVTEVLRDGPAAQAGLNVDDELLGFNDLRIVPHKWQERLRSYAPGAVLNVLVARRERLRQLQVTLGSEPRCVNALSPMPNATPQQQANLAAWLQTPPHGLRACP